MNWTNVFRVRLAGMVFLAGAVLVSGLVSAQTVSYSFGVESDMLDADFYDGKESPGSAVVEAASGRGILNIGVNPAGTLAVFWAIDLGTFQQGLFQVNVGDPSSWERLAPNQAFAYQNILFMNDGISAFVGASTVYNTSTNTFVTDNPISYFPSSVTRKETDNWVSTFQLSDNGKLPAWPVLDNGDADPGRSLTYLTDLTLGGTEELAFSYFRRDGDEILFDIRDRSVSPNIENVYRLTGVNDILLGNTSPPTSFADPRINEVRASATPNYIAVPSFSFDGSLVFTAEDYNNVFDSTGANFFPTLAAGAWDININNPDGSGYTRFEAAENQGTVIPFPTGNRIHYNNNFHSFATTLIAESDIDTETDAIPGEGTNSTTVNGDPVTVPFTLTDSAVATTTPVEVEDASGTVVELPANQVINFPAGTTTPEITIFTPVDPVAEIALPNPEIEIPVIRTFGPSGTQFHPAITVTIVYTDSEVANLTNEADLIPYLYNAGSGKFEPLCGEGDTACLAAIAVDTVNNTLTFETDHFSTYGMGAAAIVGMPQEKWAVYLSGFALMMMSIVALGYRSRRVKS